jgi:hypothetical protein
VAESYIVAQRQTGIQTYLVEASSKAEAIRIARSGEGDAVSFEIVGTGAYTAIRESGGSGS